MSQQVTTFEQFREVMRQLYDAHTQQERDDMDPDDREMQDRALYESFTSLIDGPQPSWSVFAESMFRMYFEKLGNNGAVYANVDEAIRDADWDGLRGMDEFRRETANSAARRALNRTVTEGGLGFGIVEQ